MSHNPDTPRSPASTIKTVTTFAALDMLGPHFHLANPRVALLARISDPPGRRRSVHHAGAVVELRATPARTGLKSIAGDIVIDNSRVFLTAGGSRRLRRAAESHLQRVAGRIDGQFSVDRIHGWPRIPKRAGWTVIASPAPDQSRSGKSRSVRRRPLRAVGRAGWIFKWPRRSWDRVVFSGALVPALRAAKRSRVLAAAGHLCVRHFCRAVAAIRGRIQRQIAHRATPADAKLLAYLRFLSLAEIVRLTNKYSNNLMARHLLLTLGAERYGDPATLEKGAARDRRLGPR